ncbi:MAG: hypothetical protein KAJ93_02445 [Methanosarcinales archaeon]|nr:hypothetical protein [Methanosarcinales archaeon]
MAAHYPVYETRKCCPVCNSLQVSNTFCIACGAQFKEPSTKDVYIYPDGVNMWKARETHIFGRMAEKLKADPTIAPKQMKMITGHSYHMCLKFYRAYVDKTITYTLKGSYKSE